MKFNHFAVIFVADGIDPKVHRHTIKTNQVTYTTVGIDRLRKEEVLDIAKELVANGVQIIELCGGFGPIWIAKVTEAIKGKIPVGGVFYGPECRQKLVDLGLTQTLHFD